MRLVFAGTPAFAATALQALLDAGHELVGVLTQPDRPAGRGMKLQPSAVKLCALAASIPVAQPHGLRLDGRFADEAQAAREQLLAWAPELMVVAAYGLILPRWALDLPARGCLNIHASLLPRWRGAAPIQRAIEAGDTQTGVTLMQMDEGLDTGAMLATVSTPIAPDDTSATLLERLGRLGAELTVESLSSEQPLQATAQPLAGVCYATKIDKAEALIDWRLPALEIERRLRAFDPFPGGLAPLRGEAIKIWRARLGTEQGQHGQVLPGQVLSWTPDGPQLACGEGSLILTELQRPGGKRLPASALAAALALPGGAFWC